MADVGTGINRSASGKAAQTVYQNIEVASQELPNSNYED